MRFLMLLAAGLYVAHKMEQRLGARKQHVKEMRDSSERSMDAALEDSFPASDPPNFAHDFSSPLDGEYHH